MHNANRVLCGEIDRLVVIGDEHGLESILNVKTMVALGFKPHEASDICHASEEVFETHDRGIEGISDVVRMVGMPQEIAELVITYIHLGPGMSQRWKRSVTIAAGEMLQSP